MQFPLGVTSLQRNAAWYFLLRYVHLGRIVLDTYLRLCFPFFAILFTVIFLYCINAAFLLSQLLCLARTYLFFLFLKKHTNASGNKHPGCVFLTLSVFLTRSGNIKMNEGRENRNSRYRAFYNCPPDNVCLERVVVQQSSAIRLQWRRRQETRNLSRRCRCYVT